MAVGEVKQKQRFVQKKNNCRIHFADGDHWCVDGTSILIVEA